MAFRPELLDILERLTPTNWVGVVYRHMFARLQPTLENTSGARWNPRGTAAIYTSVERETTLAEAEYRMSLEPVRPSKGRTLYKIRVHVSRVLDIREWRLLLELGITPERLADPMDNAACQAVGGSAAFLEMGGILVPSVRRDGGTNLVILPTHQAGDDEFEIEETEAISD